MVPTRNRRWVGLSFLFAAAFLAGVCWWPSHKVPEPESRRPEPETPAERSAPAEARRAGAPTAREVASDGIPIAPAGSTRIPSNEPHHPHPITPQHARIYEENNLVASLAGALDVRDTAAIRRLVAEYRDRYPEDDHQLQAGYELIANCLDRPGPDAKAAAQRYYDEELGSNIRRYVRRHCLD